MIVGLGIDVVEIDRIANAWKRFGSRFSCRILTTAEIAAMPTAPVAYLASRFAAKEAAVKALGTGFIDGITFQSVEIGNTDRGRPFVTLYGKARQMADELAAVHWHISITHAQTTASAVVILER